MTTTVTVNAHCDPLKTRVKVITNDENNPQPEVILDDGESHETVVHDEKSITVSEFNFVDTIEG